MEKSPKVVEKADEPLFEPGTQISEALTRPEPASASSGVVQREAAPAVVEGATRPEAAMAAMGEQTERLAKRRVDSGGRDEDVEAGVPLHSRRAGFRARFRTWREKVLGTPREIFGGWRAYVAEFFGTLILVLGGTGSAIASLSFFGAMTAVSVISIALGFALSVAVAVYFSALVSGGHCNPAITIAMMATANIPITMGLVYIVAQCAGAIVASAILLGAIPREVGRTVYYGANVLTMDRPIGDTGVTWSMPIGGAILLEIATTFMLVSVVFAVARLRNDPKHFGKLGPLAIGLTAGAAHLISVPFDGCSINPARSLGPAVISSSLGHDAAAIVWSNHWIFWVGPISGGLIAGLIYEFCLISPTERGVVRDQRLKVERLIDELRLA